MSEKTSTQSLAEVLAKTDEQILSNWASLGSLIKNFENVSWQKASEMARELLRDGNAMEYIEQVRSDIASKGKESNSSKSIPTKAKKDQPPKKQKEKKSEKAKIIPMNTKRDRFSMNFKRLVKIAPELVGRLESGEEVYGKSKSTGYMDFNLELIHKNARGYYLALSQNFKQNGDVVPDPDMQVLLNPKNQTLEALAFQNQFYYREVYDDIYNPKLVNEKERQSQNSFLEQWLINLDNQGHSIKWIIADESPNPIETQTKKPHVDDFPAELVSRLRIEAEGKTLGDLRKVLAAYLNGNGKFTPLFHFITAERINEITNSAEAKYPTQEALTKQSLEEFDLYGNLKEETKAEEKSNAQKSDKPDISFLDPNAIADAKKYVDSFRTLDEVIQAYLKHKNGEQTLLAHVLYFMVERINQGGMVGEVPYPTSDELQRDYKKVLEFREKNAKIDEAINENSTTSIHTENFGKIVALIPNLSDLLAEHGTKLELRSKQAELPYEFILKVLQYNDDGSAKLDLFEGEIEKNKTLQHSAMKVFFDPNAKEVFALSIILRKGEVKVYEDEDSFSGVDKSELKIQNEYLGTWLDELKEQGHKINSISPMNSEVIDEFQLDGELEKNDPESIDKTTNDPSIEKTEVEKTAKHWKKLASFIAEKEGLSKSEAKKKALELKATNSAEEYLIGKMNRVSKLSDNQLMKLNYQKLIRLMPIINSIGKRLNRKLVDKDNEMILTFINTDNSSKYGVHFEIQGLGDIRETWGVRIQKNVSKVQVMKHNKANQNKDLEFVNLDQKFGDFLDEKLKQGLKIEPTVSEIMEKFPIVIEWAEGSSEKLIGINDLQELRAKLKRFGFTDNPTETYIKNKVWFKGYPNDVRIDVSTKIGDYNPQKMDLADWLDDADPNFDWYQFNNETDVKELQKQADEIPTFEVGEVQLTKQHKRAGLTQKHINWINKHQQGMIITPVKRMTNNTADFFIDMNLKAQRPGKRISRTGRIYYETRSNRSDMTNAGL